MLNKNKMVPVLVTTLVVGVTGAIAFQNPTAAPGTGGFAGFLSHLIYGDSSFETVAPNSPEIGEIGLDVTTGDINSSQVVQNKDGDLLERVEFIQENMTQLDETDVDTMVANNGYLTAENQDLSAVLTEGSDAGGAVVSNLGTPVANADAATKEYVDAAGGTSGLPHYIVKHTTATYQWGMGWRLGANEKCKAEFGDTAIMFGTQHVNCYIKGTCLWDLQVYPPSGYAWFDRTALGENYTGNNYNNLFNFKHNTYNCNWWLENVGNWETVDRYWSNSTPGCSNYYNIACAYLVN